LHGPLKEAMPPSSKRHAVFSCVGGGDTKFAIMGDLVGLFVGDLVGLFVGDLVKVFVGN
jgi:hypothetical protein